MLELRKIEAEWRARMHKALKFDGEDDYVELENTELVFSNQTVCFWVKLNEITPGQRFIVKRASWSIRLGKEEHTKRYVILDIYDGSNWHVLYSTEYEIDLNWHFICAEWSDSGRRLYVDGKLIKSSSTPVTPYNSTYKPCIGRYSPTYPTSGEFLNGIIDEVRIYNRVLSESEIKYLYQNPFDPIDPEHLVLWLNPAGIDVANGKWWDLSGKGNHGTIHGATEVSLVKEEVKVK